MNIVASAIDFTMAADPANLAPLPGRIDSSDKRDMEKHAIDHNEVLHDHDVLGGKQISTEEAEHMGELSQEEKALERKLRRKIDLMIMPWVILVSRPDENHQDYKS